MRKPTAETVKQWKRPTTTVIINDAVKPSVNSLPIIKSKLQEVSLFTCNRISLFGKYAPKGKSQVLAPCPDMPVLPSLVKYIDEETGIEVKPSNSEIIGRFGIQQVANHDEMNCDGLTYETIPSDCIKIKIKNEKEEHKFFKEMQEFEFGSRLKKERIDLPENEISPVIIEGETSSINPIHDESEIVVNGKPVTNVVETSKIYDAPLGDGMLISRQSWFDVTCGPEAQERKAKRAEGKKMLSDILRAMRRSNIKTHELDELLNFARKLTDTGYLLVSDYRQVQNVIIGKEAEERLLGYNLQDEALQSWAKFSKMSERVWLKQEDGSVTLKA